MVRTQIQLTEVQSASLKKLARKQRVSVAELIRRSVNYLLASESVANPDKAKQRAIAAAGRFSSGKNDISVNHDEYLSRDMGT